MSVHDLWGGKRSGPGRRWEVRWRDRGTQRKRRFTNRAAAEAWNATVTLRPDEGREAPTVEAMYALWIASKAGRAPSTLHSYKGAWRAHVEPRWGGIAVDRVRAGDVAAWVGTLAATSPSVARKAQSVLAGVLGMAVLEGAIVANPAVRVPKPSAPRAEVVPLTADEVDRLAAECAPHQLVVRLLAVSGLRFGEMAGLRVGDVSRKEPRISVTRQLTTVGGRLVEGPPKGGRSRVIAVPSELRDQLLEGSGKASSPLLVTGWGSPWRSSSWKRVWRGEPVIAGRRREALPGAIHRAGLPDSTRVHDLRHTAAVDMINAGVALKVVQRQLGHAHLSITVDLYGRWASDELSALSDLWDT